MMLMIDDIRYNALGKDDRLTLAGFNIYRNGQKVNDKPVEDFDFTDNTATEKLNSYVATAVYTAGESAASNTVSLELSSIAELGSAISISADENSIVISGANGMTVNVFIPDGRNVASLKADATTPHSGNRRHIPRTSQRIYNQADSPLTTSQTNMSKGFGAHASPKPFFSQHNKLSSAPGHQNHYLNLKPKP